MKDIVVTVKLDELALDERPASMTVSVINQDPAPERIVLTAIIKKFTPLLAPAIATGATSTPDAPLAEGAGPETTIEHALRDIAAGAGEDYSVSFARGKAVPGRYDVWFIASPSDEATEEYAGRAGQLVVVVAKKNEESPPPFPWWKLIAAVVALLVVVAGVAFVLTRPGSIPVPDVVNQPQAQAEQALASAGLVPAVTKTPGVKPLGMVVSQQPAAGAEVDKDAKVTILVSTSVRVPGVRGSLVNDARTTLRAQGFTTLVIHPQWSFKPTGTVLKQDPLDGTPVALDDPITLTIAALRFLGPERPRLSVSPRIGGGG